MIVYPTTPKTELIATIIVSADTIYTKLPSYLDGFTDIVKDLSYFWNGSYWERKPGNLAGLLIDRAAELGHVLLLNGFPVEFPTEEIQSLAISGTFAPECRRWILTGRGEFEGWLRPWWGRGEDFYTKARNITGSQYDRTNHSVVIPSEQFEEILGFAEVHNFQLSSKASKLVETTRERRKNAFVVDVKQQVTSNPEPTSICHPDKLEKFYDIPYWNFSLKTTLYPHQEKAVEKLKPLRLGALFMEMGTGKTRAAIELAHLRRHRISNVVWFCPVSLKETIVYEIQKHTDIEPGNVYAFDDKTSIRSIPSALWYIVGIESMSASDRVALTANHIVDKNSFVIVDESSYIKGHDSKRTKRITQIAERARYRLILTGTPISQGIVDLYAQMRFLDSGILGFRSFYSFAANHLVFSEKYPGLVIRSLRTDEIAAKIQPLVYQVTKEECLDLLPKLYDTRYCSMTPKQRAAYQQAKEEILLSVPDDEIDSYVIFQLFSALQQVVSGFWNRDDNRLEFPQTRLAQLLDIIENVPEHEKVIIWCKYRYSVKRIAELLGNDNVALYYGDLNEKERSTELARFRDNTRFFVATQATGGFGLTLNEAHYVIFYENEFKYANRLQAEDRCHRIGQEHKVTYIDIICTQSIDERISNALSTKQNAVAVFKREVDKVKDAARLL